jgi:hypothetical protein
MKFGKKVALLMGVVAVNSAMAACPTGTQYRGLDGGRNQCALTGKYLSSTLTLTDNNDYILEGPVFIGADNSQQSVLRIAPGTKIMGQPAAFLAVMRGSKIFAEGTKRRPIVFTSLKKTGRKPGDWGGIVLNGNAPINACAAGTPVCEAVSEGIKVEQVKFGGNSPDESSGKLSFVRVEYSGYPIAPDNELNGITFNGVGNGTVVENVQVHKSADDGIEMFGGTVNMKNIVLTGNEDDSLDWDMGYVGKVQFMLIDQLNSVSDNGFEADNLKSPMDAMPRSNPTISNITMIASKNTSAYGALLRRGTSGQISNAVITGFAKACVDVDDQETFVGGKPTLTHSILNCKKVFENEEAEAANTTSWFEGQDGNQMTDPMLDKYVPKSGSPALAVANVPADSFFENVDYIGAIGSTSRSDFTKGWITLDLE